MKKIIIFRNIALAFFLPFFLMCSQSENKGDYLTTFVNPLIGSGGHGHVFVGASVPFGAVQLGPNNIFKGWDWCSGYHYSDSIVIGFSHTHLSGTGGADLGDILIMPLTGKTNLDRGKQNDISNGYASYYSHKNEVTKPGYYSLLLDKYHIKAELTATERVGVHRYTYPGKKDNHILIDLKEGIGDKSYETYLRLVDTNTIEGYRFSKGWARDQRIWFALKSNQEIEKIELFDDDQLIEQDELKAEAVKGVVSFAGNPQEVILKIGISPISSENALANINAETPKWDFDKIVSLAEEKWNKEFSKIKIETPDSVLKQIFYTALFHSFIAPVLFNDADGGYRGTDKNVYAYPEFENYSVFSLWDTYRAEHQLLTIVQPERVDDFINSMLAIYQQQGKLPQWHLMGNETNAMSGYSAAPVVVDAWGKN
ncbi:MAG: GH92 family glycosyl hydrolase, partial [Massilibacteroides sp.]|nr:GH92 family glycosyl hydrolase [Massilibacteroides sp.]